MDVSNEKLYEEISQQIPYSDLHYDDIKVFKDKNTPPRDENSEI